MSGIAGESTPALPQSEAQLIPPEFHSGVAVQLAALRAQARLVEDFPLPDELEPAPVFMP
jgi:hypothetical protein